MLRLIKNRGNMYRMNQKGFTAVEGLLIVLILAVLGFGGYYVWSQQDKKSQNTSTTTPVANQETAEETSSSDTTNISKEWFEYHSAGGKYTLKIPDGWELVENPETNILVATCSDVSCVTHEPGMSGKAAVVEGGRGGPFRFFLASFSTANMVESQRSKRGEKIPYTLSSGYAVEKYRFTQADAPEAIDIPAGATEYVYYLTKGDRTVIVSYAIFDANEKDESEIVDQMVASIK